MIEVNRDVLTAEEVESHDFFNISHERTDELFKASTFVRDEFFANRLMVGEFVAGFMDCGQTDNEKAYMAFTAGMFVGQVNYPY